MSSVPAPERVLLTYEDYRGLPDDGLRYELFEGELQVTPASSTRHQRISRDLKFILHQYVRGYDLGEVLDAPVDVLLDRGTVLQPDILFVAKARLTIITERAVEGPPDLVIEILSSSTEERDRGPKRQLYARYGVRNYWILDPAGRSLSEFILTDHHFALRGTTTAPSRLTTLLFPELPIDLGAVFG